MGRTPVTVSFAGVSIELPEGRDEGIEFGRGAEIDVDSNRFLHRRVGRFVQADGRWWIENLGTWTQLRVTGGGSSSLVAPGGRVALADGETTVGFEAGPCSYELVVLLDEVPVIPPPADAPPDGEETRRPQALLLSHDQRLLATILAEPRLRSTSGARELPSNQEAARRLGWSTTKYNRKLDWLCARLHREGVPGMRSVGGRANERRARLVDHLLATGTVTFTDLAILEDHLDRVGAPG